MKNILIVFVIFSTFLIFHLNCSEDETCDSECQNRHDTCTDDCVKNNPAGSELLRMCLSHCGSNFNRCRDKCNEPVNK